MQNIVKRYGKRDALNKLSIETRPGEILGLVGSNGAGKSTLLSIAAGNTRPTKGSIDVLGLGSFDPMVSAGRVSFMPQDALLPIHAIVQEQLMFFAQLQGIEHIRCRTAVEKALDRVHLKDRQRSRIRTLSHGMRRRLLIAQAFMGNPELILLDEPLSGLDPREVVNIRSMLAKRRNPQTVVISSHNLAEIEKICDQVAFLEEGRLVRRDSMNSITGRSQSITYMLGSGHIPLRQLKDALPDVHIEVSRVEQTDNDSPMALLRCDFKTGTATSNVNRCVLKHLLAADVEVIEVRRGSELEHAYLCATDKE